jgi:hypothetical protein
MGPKALARIGSVSALFFMERNNYLIVCAAFSRMASSLRFGFSVRGNLSTFLPVNKNGTATRRK